MTNTEALKAVYTALGGSAEGGDTNAEILNAIYTVLGGEADTSGMTNAELIEAVSTVATGGGSSDFRTCSVAIKNNTSSLVNFTTGAYIDEEDALTAGEMNIEGNASYSIDAVLYKTQGCAIEVATEMIEIEATGAAEVDGAYCVITGDCSITFKSTGK